MHGQWFSWETLRMEDYSYICNTSGNYGEFNSMEVLLCVLLSEMVVHISAFVMEITAGDGKCCRVENNFPRKIPILCDDIN